MTAASLLRYPAHVLRLIRRQPLSWTAAEALARLGVVYLPFIFFEENPADGPAPSPPPALSPIEVRPLGPEDMPAVASFPWRGIPSASFLERLERGCGCLGLLANGRLAAFSWYDLAECTFDGCRFPLEPDEAYLFDACTLPEHRGTGLAPFLRYSLYKVLAGAGRTRLLSVSDRTNRAAVRFKEKLGARPLFEGRTLGLFGRWRWSTAPPEWIASRRAAP